MTSSYQAASTQMIASIFKKATQSAPCLLFFDEFDSVARERGGGVTTEDTRIVNQLLRSLEEIRSLQGQVIVMAATNDKRSLDEAVIRPGRFDRHIMIPMPDLDARTHIIAKVLQKKPVAKNVDPKALAAISDGMSAAEITAAVDKAVFSIVNVALKSSGNADISSITITHEQLVDAFRNLYARQKSTTVKEIGWDELILSEETLRTLQRLVKLIEDPDATARIGIEAPRGVLLYGPPGTGKTTIAKVIANEAKASFFSINASDVYSKWLGEGEKNVSKLFEEARKHKPSIIFMDEIDALMSVRGRGASSEWADKMTNLILQEIDGIKDSAGLFIIGATNAPDLVDPALTRGGRLSERIEIPLPGQPERVRLFDLYLKKARRDSSVNTNALAPQAGGLSGADIKTIVAQAIVDAFDRDGKDGMVTQSDLTNAIEKVSIGPERKHANMTESDKKIIAYHEAGHALVAGVLPNIEPVQKVTLVSRGHALGYTSRIVSERVTQTRAELLDMMSVSLGGYIAEKVVFGDVTSGASSDLQKANQIARTMVTQLGMSENMGAMVFDNSPENAGTIEKEVRSLVDKAYKIAENVIVSDRKGLDLIAEKLLAVGTIEKEDFAKLLVENGVKVQPKSANVAGA